MIEKFLLCVNQKMITRCGLAACPARELGQATAADVAFWVYGRKLSNGNQKRTLLLKTTVKTT
jgi:hypothetical protein